MVNIICPHCNKDIDLRVVDKEGEQIISNPAIVKITPYTHIETPVREKLENAVNTEKASTMRDRINIEGEIINKSKPRTVNKKAGGTIEICDATLVDSIGKIALQIWGDETKTVNNGDKVRITNGYTNTFKGDVFLTVGKYGRIEVLA